MKTNVKNKGQGVDVSGCRRKEIPGGGVGGDEEEKVRLKTC